MIRLPSDTPERDVEPLRVSVYAAMGKRGQVGHHGLVPFPRHDEELLRHILKDSVAIIGEKSLDRYKFLRGLRIKPYRPSMRSPRELLEQSRHAYYDRDVWVLGGLTTWRDFAPLVNGDRIFNVVDYDGPADAWFPAKEYGLNLK